MNGATLFSFERWIQQRRLALMLYGAFFFWWRILALFPSASVAFSARPDRTQVLLYHKPVDVVTTHAVDDVLGRRNVYQDLVSRRGSNTLPSGFPTGWHAVGRLDAATSGLLLLTNDGGLVHHVTHPSHKSIAKTYEAVVMGHHDDDSPMWDCFRAGGIEIRKKQCTLPVHDVHVLDHPTATTTRVSLTLLQGMNRQVRLMFHACGSGVMRLQRTVIGVPSSNECLSMDMVPNAGDWCLLSDAQVASTLGWTCRPLNASYASAAKSRSNAGTKARSKQHSKRPNS